MTCCRSVSSKMKSQQILKPEDHRKTVVPSGHQHRDVTTPGPSRLLRRAPLCSDKHACSHSHHAPRYGTSCGNTTNFHTSTEDTDGSLRSGPSAAEPLAGTDPTVHTASQSPESCTLHRRVESLRRVHRHKHVPTRTDPSGTRRLRQPPAPLPVPLRQPLLSAGKI